MTYEWRTIFDGDRGSLRGEEPDGFGFEVIWNTDEGYRVALPHQCDAWVITKEYEHRTRDEAIADLGRFIAEAQAALAALRGEPPA